MPGVGPASREEQAVKNLSVEDAHWENEGKDEKKQDAGEGGPSALPLEASEQGVPQVNAGSHWAVWAGRAPGTWGATGEGQRRDGQDWGGGEVAIWSWSAGTYH